MTTVVIRADASVAVGSGHVMRCLALAGALVAAGGHVVFVCRACEGDLCSLVEARGFPVFRLHDDPQSPNDDADQTIAVLGDSHALVDWIVVDHYGLDASWETRIRQKLGAKVMAIDDFASRSHQCDILLDQNRLPEIGDEYTDRTTRLCRKLLGPKYALLRPEFAKARAKLQPRDGELRRILVFFGGTDPTDETTKALDGIREFGHSGMRVDVVVGSTNPHRDAVRKKCNAMPGVEYHCQIDNMAEFMAGADLSLGAGGSASWERCCLALPTVAAVLSENQAGVATALERKGVLVNLGASSRLCPADYSAAISRLVPSRLREMSRNAGTLVDGYGASRVAAELLGNAHLLQVSNQ